MSRTNVPDTGAYGAALLAAVGCGHFNNLEQAAAQWVRVVRVIEPDEHSVDIYNDMYRKYRLVFDRLKDDFTTLWGD